MNQLIFLQTALNIKLIILQHFSLQFLLTLLRYRFLKYTLT